MTAAAPPPHNAPNALPGPLPAAWRERMQGAGLRQTQATRRVLALFLQDPQWSPTHAEVLERLEALQPLQAHPDALPGSRATSSTPHAVNRVTLYRLLDRLSDCGILDRHADAHARSWRFTLRPQEASDSAGAATPVMPRFECDACHRQFRLNDASEPTRDVADQLLKSLEALGHHGQRIDLAIHGTCSGCSPD